MWSKLLEECRGALKATAWFTHFDGLRIPVTFLKLCHCFRITMLYKFVIQWTAYLEYRTISGDLYLISALYVRRRRGMRMEFGLHGAGERRWGSFRLEVVLGEKML